MDDVVKYQAIRAKKPKKILLVSRSFYPVNSPRSLRATALAKEFARQGHDVTVLTIKNDKALIPFENKYGLTIKDLGPIRFSPIKIPNSPSPRQYLKRALRRGLQLFFEYPDIELMYRVNKALRKEWGYDLLISIAVPYPIHWGVALARKKNHCIADVWIADCGDPYYGLESDSFNKLFYFAPVEKWFCRKADYISIPFEGARSAYFPEFHPKIKIIPQGLTFPERTGAAARPQNQPITFAYFGNIRSYLHYAKPFLEKLNEVDRNFRFIIFTKSPRLFKRLLNDETLKKCDIRNYVKREVLLAELSGVDFLVHFPYQKNSQKSLKLIDYAYLNKPVLSYTNDENSAQTLTAFMNRNFKNSMPLDDYTKYKIENVAAQFLELSRTERQLASL